MKRFFDFDSSKSINSKQIHKIELFSSFFPKVYSIKMLPSLFVILYIVFLIMVNFYNYKKIKNSKLSFVEDMPSDNLTHELKTEPLFELYDASFLMYPRI